MVKLVLSIVILNKQEEFLQFLDPKLCTVEESIEYGGLRTLSLEYEFTDLYEDKKLFEIGNKIWISGDVNLSDCLYVINTEVTQDIYKENSFSLELEEILVELTYAPLFSQTELSSAVDDEDKEIFRVVTNNGKQEVYVDWNALNYWFGDYFNIGVVQKCISDYASRISITGTVNRMTLLRQIEEQTGNIFVTRYEKDVINNTIHRYLDFLNPINANKDWIFNIEYDFYDVTNVSVCYDEDGNITNEDAPEDVHRYENTKYPPEDIGEDDEPRIDEDEYDVEQIEDYDKEANEIYDYDHSPEFTPILNFNPIYCDFRITNGKNLLDVNGQVYDGTDTALKWDCADIGVTDEGYPQYFLILQKQGDKIGVTINHKSFCISSVGVNPASFIASLRDSDDGVIALDYDLECTTLPDDAYFEIYNFHSNKTLFRTQLNTKIGHIHEEILDFAFNVENIKYSVDETDTYTAVSPVISLNSDSDKKTLSRTDIDTIIDRWINLEVKKGWVIPMIVEKTNIKATSLSNAQTQLGAFDKSSNYWIRPLKPVDNLDSTDKEFEFYRAIAYWSAPYAKNAGEMHVATDKILGVNYTDIYTRTDTRDERSGIRSPKQGNTETSDEDIYAIYNQVASYLKKHEEPTIKIDVDVANLVGHEYNNYSLHDKIYLKLDNTKELITARVTKTEKEAHDVAKNKIEISNYKNINTIKTIQHETYIDAQNPSFKYPNTKKLTAQLVNIELDNNTEEYPANKLITFTLYKVENDSTTFTGKVYTKLTDSNGCASINMKYDPADYEITIRFAGDEEYAESETTVRINVSGKKTVTQTTKKATTKAKTTNKTSNKKTKTIKTYWDKYGRSPDKKKIMAIGRISAPRDKGSYANFYEMQFANKCPHCGKATLTWGIYWAGNETKNWGKFPATGRIEGGSAEGHIFCTHCDADYSVQGNEHIRGGKKLKALTKLKKSTKTRAYTLKKGKLLYATKTVNVSAKQTQNSKNRYIRASNISASVKKKALSIVGNSTGASAMKKIVAWIDRTSNMSYADYPNFVRSPSTCLTKRSANCCDGTRLFFQLCDSAGLCEYFDFYYIHVYGHVYGQIVTKKTKKKRYVDCASDSHTCWGYVCRKFRGRSVIHKTKYPQLPF